jgi:microcystin-dependent protein
MKTTPNPSASFSKPVRAGISGDQPFQDKTSSVRSGIIRQETAVELNREPREPRESRESRENQKLGCAGERWHAFARPSQDGVLGKPSPFAYFGYFAVPSAPFRKPLLLALLALSTLNLRLSTASAQTTAITFQGQLTSGAGNANGSYDLRFAVYDANVAGNFIAGPVTNSAVTVSNGLLTVALDFGPGVFTGTNYWVELGVRTNGGAGFAALVPRQQLTPTPYALYAPQASNALFAAQAGSAVQATSLSAQSPQINSLCPPGSVMAYLGTTAPSGWFLCDGTAPSRTTYSNLFAVIGTTYGTGNGSTTFNLPDLRGVFLRGLDSGKGYDTGRTLGSYQADIFASHTHSATRKIGFSQGAGSFHGSEWTADTGRNETILTDTTTPAGGSETRPKNVAVNYIIKY